MLSSFNVVVIGDSFPVSSLRAGDFSFRHRQFKEDLRIGPAFQASAAGVLIACLPDRFQVSVTQPDDLETQAAGVGEVLATFMEYAGRRTLKAIGHNAQAQLTDSQQVDVYDTFFKREVLDPWLATAGAAVTASASFQFHVGREDYVRVTLAPVLETEKLGLDFNFHFDLIDSARLEPAMSDVHQSMVKANELAARFVDMYTGVEAK